MTISAADEKTYIRSLSKRAFDIVVATAGLLLLSPLILVISFWITTDSPGPILCRRKRYSSNNVEFEIFEFRTTLVDQRRKTSEYGLDEMHCITGVGHVLHRSGMNKLPQLMNVLRGEMSIVGTHLFTTALSKPFPLLNLYDIRPGLVTWTHASEDQCETADAAESMCRSISCDRYYVENSSFFFDMKILFHTLLSKATYL
jgi:lipopolysaccharide/colanic/teichoic acid biosynthesis glycosyltransferase